MKQDIYANRALDFNKLDHREFEEVVYHYFKDQIENGLYTGIYDDVKLSSGVGEKGADVVLFLNGTVKAVVQCKKYKSNIGIQLVLSEIIKFLLYYILEQKQTNTSKSTLINDIEDFTYYLVASKDFTTNASILLGTFNTAWAKQNITPIFKNVVSQKSFEVLDQQLVYEELKELLDNINISAITGVDLDPFVRVNPYLRNRYFSIPELTPDISAEKSKVNNLNKIDEPISADTANKISDLISNDITRVKSYFGNKETLSIHRPEVEEIFKWVHKIPKENESNIAIVAGNAGMGKTVILSQLYEKLKSQDIPVISLKADKLVFHSFKDLEHEYNLDVSFEQLFDEILKEQKVGVLLIDQIDALSQALSSDLKPLRFYDNLIQRFSGYPKIRIIISTRIYDLNYDPIIANYKGKKSFIVKPLNRAQLFEVLSNYGIKKGKQFTDAFLDLISTPLHLDVFLKVYGKGLNLNEIKTLQDLYSELWKQKILEVKSINRSSVSSNNLSSLIYEVASKMYELQEINISPQLFEDEYYEEINYLKSVGIFTENNAIEFFHQSFFDYAYARNFIKSDKDLLSDILSRHQGLFIRSKVKQILNYKSNVLNNQYINDIKNILQHNDVRFHIKLLVLQQIAFQEIPTFDEKKVVKEIVFQNSALQSTFSSLIMGVGWLSFFIENDIFRKDIEENNQKLKGQITATFRRFALSQQREDLLRYYNSLKDSPIKDELVLDYFWQVREIKQELAIELIENVFSNKGDYQKQYWFFRVLEHSAQHFPEWVAKELRNQIDIPKSTDIADDKNYFYPAHQGNEVYEKLWEKHPYIAYKLVKDIIREIISKRQYESTITVLADAAYLLYDRKNIDLYKHYEQLDNLQKYLENEFLVQPNFVRRETQAYLESIFITEILIGFSVLHKYPKEFIDEAYFFFKDKEKVQNLYSVNQYLNYMMLEVFGIMYHELDEERKNILDEELISDFRKNVETRVFTNRDGEKSQNKWFGIGKYELLSSIDTKGKLPFKFKREFQELYRKFGKVDNKEPEGISVSVNRDPINANYDKLSLADWKNSFKKYNQSLKSFNSWNQPSEHEHGRKFANVVSNDPKAYIEFISEMIADKEISNTYVIKALDGLVEGKIGVKTLKDLFVKALNEIEFDKENTLYLIWVSNYFSKAKKVYPEILDFLKNNILNGDEGRENVKDALSMGINSVRGAAASSLADYSFSEETFEFICTTLETLIDNSRPSTRAAAIYKLQYLIRYDDERVLHLFLGLANDYHSGVLKISINPLQYLVHRKFDELVPFFAKALKVKESKKEIGKLITIAYCNGYMQSDELLELYLEYNEPNELVQTAFEFIKNSHKVKRALIVVNRFLESESKEIAQIYNRAFFHIKPEQFAELHEFLFKYVKSNIGKWREHPFYNYLLKCSGTHYNDCIQLASHYRNHHGPDITERRLNNEPLKVVISAYNAIREYEKQSPILEMAINIFDDILQNENYRDYAAHQILTDVDAY